MSAKATKCWSVISMKIILKQNEKMHNGSSLKKKFIIQKTVHDTFWLKFHRPLWGIQSLLLPTFNCISERIYNHHETIPSILSWHQSCNSFTHLRVPLEIQEHDLQPESIVYRWKYHNQEAQNPHHSSNFSWPGKKLAVTVASYSQGKGNNQQRKLTSVTTRILSGGFCLDFSTSDALCTGDIAFVYRWRGTSEQSWGKQSNYHNRNRSIILKMQMSDTF